VNRLREVQVGVFAKDDFNEQYGTARESKRV